MKAMTCLIVALTLIVGGSAAYGGDFFFRPADPLSSFEVGANWYSSCDPLGTQLNEVPNENDNATICNSKTCTMNADHEVMTISTENTGILIIPVGKTLTLNLDEGVSTIDGAIGLKGAIHIVIFDNIATTEWHQFAGAGHIVGEDAGAKILIQTGGAFHPNELILSTTVRGMLEIGKLVSEQNDQTLVLKGGSVIADAHGTLRINTGAMRDEADAGERSLLEVSKYSDAVLQIDVGCQGTPLASFCKIFCLEYTDAEILEGTLDLDVAIVTEGDLTMEPGGVLDVDAASGVSAWFRFADCSTL